MKKKYLVITIIILVLIASFSLVYGFASSNEEGSIVGSIFKRYKIDNKHDSKEVVVKVNDFVIEKDTVDYYKDYYISLGVDKDEKEIINKLIADKLIFEEAIEAGVYIEDEVVNENMNMVRENMPKDKDGYSKYLSFLDEIGWSEDEYWEKAFSVYKKAYIIGKYRNFVLKEEFKKDNKELSSSELETKFTKFYDDYVKKLVDNAKIEYLS